MHAMKGLSQVRRKMELLLKGKGRVLVTSETRFQEIMSVLIVELGVACFQCFTDLASAAQLPSTNYILS